jgi:transcriptional regulator with XRE-family HTH domain
MALAQSIRVRRLALSLSQGELARLAGVSQQLINALEGGKINSTKYIQDIAMALECKPVDLGYGLPPQPDVSSSESPNASDELPVYALERKDTSASHYLQSLDPVDFIRRPDPLHRVVGAYALFIADKQMAPEFDTGDVALVNPHLPATPGFTYVFRASNTPGVATAVARLIEVSVKQWHIRIWNSPHMQDDPEALNRDAFPDCHRIIGRFVRR